MMRLTAVVLSVDGRHCDIQDRALDLSCERLVVWIQRMAVVASGLSVRTELNITSSEHVADCLRITSHLPEGD